ncbi:hypothetical protein KM043_008444 [Ampulex compressa]|nr:hypothetical protein KM043_008444 [Ampulex compressa]
MAGAIGYHCVERSGTMCKSSDNTVEQSTALRAVQWLCMTKKKVAALWDLFIHNRYAVVVVVAVVVCTEGRCGERWSVGPMSEEAFAGLAIAYHL